MMNGGDIFEYFSVASVLYGITACKLAGTTKSPEFSAMRIKWREIPYRLEGGHRIICIDKTRWAGRMNSDSIERQKQEQQLSKEK